MNKFNGIEVKNRNIKNLNIEDYSDKFTLIKN